jgi:hypothetical protein
MSRTVKAALVGAVVAVALSFLVVAVLSAVSGVPEMFNPEHKIRGWEGAQYGVLLFAFLGVAAGWPFPAIALTGAAVGVVARLIADRRTRTDPPNLGTTTA